MNDFFNCGVYRWLNTVNGKSYVGSSSDVKGRKYFHLSSLRAHKHHSIKFQRSWDKHGPDVWEFEMLAFCPENDLLRQEQMALDAFDVVNNGYNICPIAGRNGAGIKCSDEKRKQLSIAIKALWSSKKFQERQHTSRCASWAQDKDRKQKMSERISKWNLSREYPINIVERTREMANKLWEDPEFRATMAASWTSERRAKMATIMLDVRKSSPRIVNECESHRETIMVLMAQGYLATDIWRELRDKHGLQVGPQSALRFIRRLRGSNIQAKYNRDWLDYLAHPNLCRGCGVPIIPKRRGDLSMVQKRKYCGSTCANGVNNRRSAAAAA